MQTLAIAQPIPIFTTRIPVNFTSIEPDIGAVVRILQLQNRFLLFSARGADFNRDAIVDA